MTTYSWTQPMCDECFAVFEKGRIPVRMTEEMRDEETCVNCGKVTLSGIYYRIDPKIANHPTIK
jgi:hypothetical protein